MMKFKQALILFAVLFLSVCHSGFARTAPRSESDRRIYSDAFAAAGRGDWARAQRIAAAGHDQLAATILRWLRDKQSGSGATFAEITSFIDTHPDWPAQKQLLQHAEEAIESATDSQATAWFSAHPPVLPAARLRQAQIWMAAGRQDDARDLIRQTWIEGDFTTVEEKLMLQRYHDVLRGEDDARRLDRLIWDGQNEQAKRMLRHVSADTAALGQARLALAADSTGIEGFLARVPARLQNDSRVAL
jgi:soluble lytic murein transglycosylase